MGKIILDSTLDWEDFGYLLEKLSELFAGLLETGKTLAESGNIKYLGFETIIKRVNSVDDNIQHIRELLKISYEPVAEREKKGGESIDSVQRGAGKLADSG